ncbi:MAG: DUF4062 domain-containing protein [Verrucomicrobia bacterium]|nr:DUF4062 domain-containing protein [Verrucomicrobiota bacterium]
MPDITRRRYEVFVGSTFEELKDARQQIIEAILLAGHIPCGTELWPAEPQPPTGVIQGYLRPCDIHVLIVGHRYGSLVPKQLIPKEPACKIPDQGVSCKMLCSAKETQSSREFIGKTGSTESCPTTEAEFCKHLQEVSFTHWEYLQSVVSNRPIIVFLQDDTEVDEERKKLPKGDPDLAHEKRFSKFRDKLKKQDKFMLVRFSNTSMGIPKLAMQCIAALSRLTSSGLMPTSSGWIRADSRDAETLRAIEGNAFLKRVMDQIRQFEVLADRVTQNIGAKEAMAQHFWFFMQSRIRAWGQKINGKRHSEYSADRGTNLFFESGSSLAYVALEFERAVLNEAGVREDWHIRTNNILCLLEFDLYTAIDGRCFPDGKPDPRDKYGAIFPHDWGVLHREPPIEPRKCLSNEERCAVDKLRKEFQEHGPTFVLAATSGWDTNLSNPEFRSNPEFQGPHVGSHKNMLFKRVVFTAGYPLVLFIDAEKLGYQRQRNCYPVFGADLPMGTWLNEQPVAVCVGWEWPKRGSKQPTKMAKVFEPRNKAEYVRNILPGLGFSEEFFCEERVDRAGIRTGAILLANKKFREELADV